MYAHKIQGFRFLRFLFTLIFSKFSTGIYTSVIFQTISRRLEAVV